MRKILLILSGILFCFTGISQSVSPEVYATSGDHYTGTNAQLSWTIGEPVIETVSNTNNIITQGFHQTNYDITSIKENPDLGFNISVFPNPISNTLQININGDVDNSNLKIELTDITGKILTNEKIAGTVITYQLNMREYATGSYFLKITTEKGKLINSYKIQKVN
ncbi:MAG: T9SS type A sorting domain-containing protein [Cytophagales bacterium]|nr:T9SS type A sorting domain-containing protein [Cytophagales bacterium]